MSVLYVSDLDGTLLQPGGQLSQYARETLAQLLSEGLQFTVATARSVSTVRPILGDLPITLPIISGNGAYVIDYGSGRHLSVSMLDEALAQSVAELCGGGGRQPCIATLTEGQENLYLPSGAHIGTDLFRELCRKRNDTRLRDGYDLAHCLRESVTGLSYFGEELELRELRQALHERHGDLIQTQLFVDNELDCWWLLISSREVCKSLAIERLKKLAPHVAECRVTAFGDQLNDLQMLKAADVAVAVDNADPEVKRIATHVIGSNESDAVVRYIAEEWARTKATA